MYLDKGDYGYKKHYVQVPVIPEEGYTGKVDETGSPIDIEHYHNWLDSLPKVWQNNPFHNHFIYVEPDTTDQEIMDMGVVFLKEAYAEWATDRTPNIKNKPHTLPVFAATRLEAVKAKVQHLKDTILERKV